MSPKTKTLLKSVLYSLLSIASITMASPSLAAAIDLSTSDTLGDAITSSSQATITNAVPDGRDDATNYNVSGKAPEQFLVNLETSLGLNAGTLGLDATEGSAIALKLLGLQRGDVLSFNSDFKIYDTINLDRAFVSIRNTTNIDPAQAVIRQLASGISSFSYTFADAGDYNIGIGVLDVDDTSFSSELKVSDARLTPVPEPITILGSATALGFGAVMRRRFSKKVEE
ncbi:hypothetical protein NIES4071_76880 [Calothrix sp. NIES-4071]|nr:hypothetical protein NIES4071_76880 [Calothrix sp. NIES-4071]BAZ61962.1 hypothetical protein NIES4105_76820 [Calothrix sp. NIES-4105]